jgi:hypothetical protein
VTARARAGPSAALVALQRTAGNRATGSLLARKGTATPGLTVHGGSKLDAAALLKLVTGNAKVPDWLRGSLAAKGGRIVEAKPFRAPADRNWLFLDSLHAALTSGAWDLTTASSKIVVRADTKGKLSFSQDVTPDLGGEHAGMNLKTGPGETTFSPTAFHSDSPEVIYGWTEPDTVTEHRSEKRGLVMVVTAIDVTAPDGTRKQFTPGADALAEAILHETAVHAGRIAQGRPDTHDDSNAVVSDVVDQIGGLFRDDAPGGGLKPGPLTAEIMAFIAAHGAADKRRD